VIQALDRTQPMLPMKPGQVERHSRDDQRNGTTSLFAALEVATGRVTNQATVRHRPEEFLDFLNLLVRTYPRRQIHVVLDNVSSHKTPEVQPWLRRHKRFHFHFHFTPTSASWMNQIETWAGILTRQALRRGTFDRVKALVAMIEAFTRSWNEGASPFMWVKTADEILAKAVRKPRVTSESGHWRRLRQRAPELPSATEQ
jgi:transposase